LWLLKRRTPRSLLLIGAALLLALGLSACFWLPAFFEKQWVKIHLAYTPAGMNYRYNFLSLGELLSPPIPAHTSLMNPAPPRSPGLVQLVLALLAMAGWWSFEDGEKHFNVLFFSFVLIGLIFMVLPQSVAIWDHLPLFEYVQFPWRFLGLASLAAALLAGAAIRLLCDRVRAALPAFVIVLAVEVLVIAFSLPWLYPRYCYTTEGLSIANLARLERGLGVIGTTSAGEYLPIWVKEVPSESGLEAMYRAGVPIERLESSSLPQGAALKSAEYGLTSADILIESPQPFWAVFNSFYFPGWRAYVDGKQVPIVPTEPYGLISFEVPVGESNLQVRFQDTPLRFAAKALSALSALVVLGLGIGYWILDIGDWRLEIGRSSGEGRNTEYAIRNTKYAVGPSGDIGDNPALGQSGLH
ncbi:MAG: hypothetical protein ISS50_05025, partial [Anaerolineae bacterium]|nr:hypothetical protein [Anaerolineae bacterium]